MNQPVSQPPSGYVCDTQTIDKSGLKEHETEEETKINTCKKRA